MPRRYSMRKGSDLKPNPRCPPERQINILLLGQTGVGKTTFINAFANYIVHNTVEEAEEDEMQVIIPSSFSYTEPDTFDEKAITLGKESEHEKFFDVGQSNTQQCRSFVFPIGDRNLRFIDTPGIGDTRGLDHDAKNFQEILNYIAQYEHLNGVCILLKPNEERLTVLFRFCINELLRHLHVGASENLIFVFTNSRSTFFMPGTSKKLLQTLLDKHRMDYNVKVPFSKHNTFLLDNEPFRYLALRKHNIHFDDEQTQSYSKSWNISVREYGRLMEHIVGCPLHAISNTVSLNEAEQLVRKLARPIAETAKLIEENIQLAKRHKNNVLENPSLALEGIPQNNAVVVPLNHPRTVCVGENCCRVIDDGDEMKMEYLHICHDECYLKGVVQESLYDPKLEECTAMDPEDGFCKVCDCHWLQHKHITYEYTTNRTSVRSSAMTLTDIDKRISDLRAEEKEIQDVYKKLAGFLHANAILPINDEIVAYLEYFIREEQMKQSAGAGNTAVIDGLNKMLIEFKEDIELLKKTLHDGRNAATNDIDISRPEDIFTLVGTLYRLPINGRQIREQVDGIKINQERYGASRENNVSLPSKATSSRVMVQMEEITCMN